MSSIKESLIEKIKALPDDVTMEKAIADLWFRHQVETGIAELDAGKGIPHEEVERRMASLLGE